MNTSLKVKQEHFKEFFGEIEKQLNSGGKRYALSDDKEMTDLVCEIAGNQWILGNIIKYCGEYKNTGIKRNLFKIATYAFILWLKDYEKPEIEDEGEK